MTIDNNIETTELGLKLAAALSTSRNLGDLLPKKMTASPQPSWDSMRIEAIPWEDDVFGIVHIGVEGFTLCGQRELGSLSRAQINWEGQRPNRIKVFFEIGKLTKGVRAICLINGKLVDVTDARAFPCMWVDVEWRGVGKDAYPVTRQKGKDNFDLLLMMPDGFVMLQTWVTVRGKQFWLSVQDVYVGQTVMATKEQVDKLGIQGFPIADSELLVAIVPLTDEFAYPAADFVRSFGYARDRVLDYSAEQDLIVLYDDSDPTQWKHNLPPELPSKMVQNGWQRGTVMWFNAGYGCGEILTENNERVWVHFSSMIDKAGQQLASLGQFPHLEHQTGVAVKWSPGKDGERNKATAVRKKVA